jgi:hypothetical protein
MFLEDLSLRKLNVHVKNVQNALKFFISENMQQKERSMRECRNRAAPLYRVVYICIKLKKNALMPGLTRQFWHKPQAARAYQRSYRGYYTARKYVSTVYTLSTGCIISGISQHTSFCLYIFSRLFCYLPNYSYLIKKVLVFLFLISPDIIFTLSFHLHLFYPTFLPLFNLLSTPYIPSQRETKKSKGHVVYVLHIFIWGCFSRFTIRRKCT